MHTEPLTADDLRDHWTALDRFEKGDASDERYHYVPTRLMPPWTDICFWFDWRMFHVREGKFTEKDYGHYGVYRIVLLQSGSRNKPVGLNRAFGQDPTGTLYIGRSSCLHRRLNNIRRSATAGKSHHQAISMQREISVMKFPSERLAIAPLFTIKNTRAVENELIRAYMNSFGDTPPLNYRL